MKPFTKALPAIAALLCLAAFTARAADDLPPGVTLVKPEAMKWEKSASGRENAYLMGHPSKIGRAHV